MNQTIFIPQEITDASSLPKEAGVYCFIHRTAGEILCAFYSPYVEGEMLSAIICYSHWLRPVIVATPENVEQEAESLAHIKYPRYAETNGNMWGGQFDGFQTGYIAAKSIPSAADLAVQEVMEALKELYARTDNKRGDYLKEDVVALVNAKAIIAKYAHLLPNPTPICKSCGKPLGHSESFTGYDCQTEGCTENPLTL